MTSTAVSISPSVALPVSSWMQSPVRAPALSSGTWLTSADAILIELAADRDQEIDIVLEPHGAKKAMPILSV